MFLLSIFSDYSLFTILSLIILCFAAGFVDSVIGGGGLIQLPAMLINFPNTALPVIFGTNKIASLAGTSMAAFQYAKRIRFNYTILLLVAAFAGAASFAGARVVSHINVTALKPAILVVLIVIAIYTFIKKDLGSVKAKHISLPQQLLRGAVMGMIVGFYDGDKYFGLPYNKKNFIAGNKLSFDDANADLTTNDEVQVWNGRDGIMEITSVNASWVEGKFFFTGHSYDAKHTITVTEGFFRIPVKGKKNTE